MHRTLMLVGASLVILGATLYMLHMKHFEASITHGQTRTIAVVLSSMSAGTPITQSRLGVREVPARYVDARHIHLDDIDRAVGQRVLHDLPSGAWLTWTDLSVVNRDYGTLSEQIDDNMRAISLPVASESLGPLLRPGDHADILLTGIQPGTEVRYITTSLLQNVKILALGSEYVPDDEEEQGTKRNLTLSLDLRQAMVLAQTAENSSFKLYVAIRHADDHEVLPPVLITDIDWGTEAIRDELQYRDPDREAIDAMIPGNDASSMSD